MARSPLKDLENEHIQRALQNFGAILVALPWRRHGRYVEGLLTVGRTPTYQKGHQESLIIFAAAGSGGEGSPFAPLQLVSQDLKICISRGANQAQGIGGFRYCNKVSGFQFHADLAVERQVDLGIIRTKCNFDI